MTVVVLLLSLVFWGAVGLLALTYVGYPLAMRWLAKGRGLPGDRFEEDGDFPEIAVLMAVYNEEKVLPATLASILE